MTRAGAHPVTVDLCTQNSRTDLIVEPCLEPANKASVRRVPRAPKVLVVFWEFQAAPKL